MTTMVLDIGGTAIKSGLYTDGKLAKFGRSCGADHGG